VNRLAQFLHYAQKVFALKLLLRGVGDERPFATIPTAPILISLVLGAVLRVVSYLDLAQQTQRRRWRHLCGLKTAISDDTFGYATERLNLQDLRHVLAEAAKTLKRNKALESCKLKGLLFVSLDANEHFASRSRCCPRCCQRQLEETDDQGHKRAFTEYYHRYVYAQINGPKMNVVLDIEPIAAGQDECAAALRLLGRMRRAYGPRFFDGITADAWYAKGPFLKAVRKLGWMWTVVLKRQNMEIYREAISLTKSAKPSMVFEDKDRNRQVELWKAGDLDFSESYDQPVWIVRSQEQWTQKRIVGGKKTATPQTSQWLWCACQELAAYGEELVYQAGHRRWGIENKAFNELTQHYGLEHCYHHEPTSMLAQLLVLLIGFTLFTAFAQLQSKLVSTGKESAKALAKQMDLALEEDLPWQQWFASG
jgi:hypothetical protein